MDRHEAIWLVYSRLPVTLAVSFVNAALIVYVMARQGTLRLPLAWLGSVAVISAGRMLLYLRYRADGDREAHARFWARALVVGALCSGIVWGIGPLLPFGHHSGHQWLWAFAIGGMCAGSASINAAHFPTSLAFILPTALPLAVSLALQNTPQGTVAAVLTAAFLGLTIFTAFRFSRTFEQMQAMRAAIEARATDLDTSNRRLSEEIADHRRTSEALYQVQKMEALGNLTGGFAHDFNNILMVIIAHLEMIAKGRSPAATAELAYKAIGAAQSGADLTARMLAFARQQTLTPHPTELVAVVREFQQFVTHAVSGNIVVDYDIAVPAATSNIDAAQFQSVLLNLVVNARDAMPDGGGITISVARTRLDAGDLRGTGSAPGDFIAVSVADNGEGMSAQTLERAFEPFFTTKAATGGTGLGLPQVYGFARQSGGVARIESSPGQGTRVTIFIPEIAPDERAQPPSTAASQRPIRRTCSVLLVDDNVAVLQAVEQGLIDEGWTVQPVDNAASALDAVASGTAFDIVVTDIDMPGSIGGLQLAKQLTGRFPVPVLLISGAPISAEVYDSGFPLIVKPFRKAELVERIQAIVEAREAARAPGLPREP